MFENGDWSTKINQEKQVNHMESTRKPGKSYFYNNVDVQKLVDDYAGTGELDVTRTGDFTNKEVEKTDKIIGVNISRKDEILSEEHTHWAKLHYSAKRTHVVSTHERDD